MSASCSLISLTEHNILASVGILTSVTYETAGEILLELLSCCGVGKFNVFRMSSWTLTVSVTTVSLLIEKQHFYMYPTSKMKMN
jgi:hypothetical protein